MNCAAGALSILMKESEILISSPVCYILYWQIVNDKPTADSGTETTAVVFGAASLLRGSPSLD